MKAFSDEEVLAHMEFHYAAARGLPRVNSGQSRESRNTGDNANSGNNWIMWRREARERGLV